MKVQYPREKGTILVKFQDINRLNEIQNLLEALRVEEEKIRKSAMFQCGHCNHTIEINKLIFYETVYYSSYMGDYYQDGNNIICPKCLNHSYIDNEIEFIHKYYFKTCETIYKSDY